MTTPARGPEDRRDNPFEQRLQVLHSEACQRIDPATAGRLRAARRRALQSVQKPGLQLQRWLVPAGALAALGLAVLIAWQPRPRNSTATIGPDAGTQVQGVAIDNDLPPDADRADPNLYQNLDFYGWLAANESPPDSH